MSNDAFPVVYFSCPLCALIFTATQERRAERRLGAFFCDECGTPVLEWTGCYNFIKWTPVMRAKRHDRRFW